MTAKSSEPMEVREPGEPELTFLRMMGSDPMPKFVAKDGRTAGYGQTREEAVKNLEAGKRHAAAMLGRN